VRFVFTLNMPSFKNNLVQQIIGDHAASSFDEMCEALNNDLFIVVKQFYNVQHRNGEREWQYKGPMILNAHHIGKVQEFVAKDDEVY
jgi:hypothetical protein